MNKNPNDPIIDQPEKSNGSLTKREYLAALALQGYISNEPLFEKCKIENCVVFAVHAADLLIAQLNKTQR